MKSKNIKMKTIKFNIEEPDKQINSLSTIEIHPKKYQNRKTNSLVEDSFNPKKSKKRNNIKISQTVKRVVLDKNSIKEKLNIIEQISNNLLKEYDHIEHQNQQELVNIVKNQNQGTDDNTFTRNVLLESDSRSVTNSKQYINFVKKINKKWREKEYKKRFKVSLIRNIKRAKSKNIKTEGQKMKKK